MIVFVIRSYDLPLLYVVSRIFYVQTCSMLLVPRSVHGTLLLGQPYIYIICIYIWKDNFRCPPSNIIYFLETISNSNQAPVREITG